MLHCHNRFWSWVIPSLLKKICYQLLNIDLTKFPPPFPGPPGPPGGLLVKNVAETSVELRWSRGYDNHSPIGRYIIRGRSSLSSQWKKIMTGVCAWVCVCVSLKWYLVLTLLHSPDPVNIEGNAESARVMGLIPWMDYEFQVIASNILGSGEPSMPSQIIRTQQAGEDTEFSAASEVYVGPPGGQGLCFTAVFFHHHHKKPQHWLICSFKWGSGGLVVEESDLWPEGCRLESTRCSFGALSMAPLPFRWVVTSTGDCWDCLQLLYWQWMYVCPCPSAPTVAPSGLSGGGGNRNELIVTWTVSGRIIPRGCTMWLN